MAKLVLYKAFPLEKLEEFAYENKCSNKWLSEVLTLGWHHRLCGKWNRNIQQCHVAVWEFSFFRKQLKFSHREQRFLSGQSFPDTQLNFMSVAKIFFLGLNWKTSEYLSAVFACFVCSVLLSIHMLLVLRLYCLFSLLSLNVCYSILKLLLALSPVNQKPNQ